MRTARWLLLAFVALLTYLAGSCTPVTMAYPVRLHLGPTPEPLGRGMGATEASLGLIFPADFWAPLVPGGGLRQYVGLTSWLDLDADFTMAGAGQPYVGAMGSLGLRFYPVRHRYFKLGLGIGGGLGCGGMRATGEEESDYRAGCLEGAPGHLAVGGYADLMLGLRPARWIGIYAGIRYQLADSRDLPRTHWVQYGGGVEFTFPRSRLIFITVEGGLAHFYNVVDRSAGGFLTGSLGVRYGRAAW